MSEHGLGRLEDLSERVQQWDADDVEEPDLQNTNGSGLSECKWLGTECMQRHKHLEAGGLQQHTAGVYNKDRSPEYRRAKNTCWPRI